MNTVKVSLYSCMGCQYTIDNYIVAKGKFVRCPRCFGKHFKPVQPTLKIVIRYFLHNPRHTFKLLWLDLRGKSYEPQC